MGNNPSRQAPSSGSGSAATPTTPTTTAGSASPGHAASSRSRETHRRDSIQVGALAAGKATAAPPSETLQSATGQSSSAHRAPSAHSRQRSATIDPTPTVLNAAADGKMGNEQSRHAHSGEGSSHHGVLPFRREVQGDPIKPYSPSQPVNVPASGDGAYKSTETDAGFPPVPTRDVHYIPPSQSQRPPRLPLPIEEELHTPGSPIISPADVSSALREADAKEEPDDLPRKSSMLSTTTVDDEEEATEDFQPYPAEGTPGLTVPTLIQWKYPGEKVYVTGTFANWNRKFRLQRTEGKEGLSSVIPLAPGTHHLKFIIDGDMRTSDDLPTAVDYTNILVNYIEVRADAPTGQSTDSTAADGPDSRQSQQEASQAGSDAGTTQVPPGVHPPQTLPPSPNARPSSQPAAPEGLNLVPEKPRNYTNKIPQYLLDLDAPEDSPEYARASAAIAQLPPPPSLPLFLGKSILNGSTPMKDDNSVLTMPNHTVLNHLATSSIKNNVLATSGTTRYKHKYITTIMYKPTNEERK